mgnify:CR=1 FL=1
MDIAGVAKSGSVTAHFRRAIFGTTDRVDLNVYVGAAPFFGQDVDLVADVLCGQFSESESVTVASTFIWCERAYLS